VPQALSEPLAHSAILRRQHKQSVTFAADPFVFPQTDPTRPTFIWEYFRDFLERPPLRHHVTEWRFENYLELFQAASPPSSTTITWNKPISQHYKTYFLLYLCGSGLCRVEIAVVRCGT
jgi:hypothetical protein